MLLRISEIDVTTWECEGSESDVNAYLATKDAEYLRRSTVEISRDPVKNTVTARVSGGLPPPPAGFAWERINGHLQFRRPN